MHKLFVIGVSVASVMLASSSARAGRPPAPAWCKVDGRIQQGNNLDLKNNDTSVQLAAVAYMECSPEYVNMKDGAEADAAFQRLSASLDIMPAEWAEVAEWATDKHHDRSLRPKDKKAKWSTLPPSEQYAEQMEPLIVANGVGAEVDPAYVADAFGAHLSELGRLGYMVRCLGNPPDAQLGR